MFKIIRTFFYLTLLSSWICASYASAKKLNKLRLDVDIIEGKKQKPDLFVAESGMDLNAVRYIRTNFNDFHKKDKKKKPKVMLTQDLNSEK